MARLKEAIYKPQASISVTFRLFLIILYYRQIL